MEPGPKIESNKLETFLQEVADSVKNLQDQNQKVAANHSERIECNLQAIQGLVALINSQNQLINTMRGALIKLWEDRYGPDADPMSGGAVN